MPHTQKDISEETTLNSAKATGRWGEELAAKYLKDKNYRILEMGYTTRFGEIDIIAEDEQFVAFVEVKTRKNASFAGAREFVNREKQRRLITTANLWLEACECDKQPRFDVIEIYADKGAQTVRPFVRHIKNAFEDFE